MALLDEQCRHTEAVALLIMRARTLGFRIKVQEWNRTIEQQAIYVRDKKSKTMDSRHLDRCATDFVLVDASGRVITAGPEFRALGEYWESLGGRWGGRFGVEHESKAVQNEKLGWDSPHFETRKGAA